MVTVTYDSEPPSASRHVEETDALSVDRPFALAERIVR
jgi:hypothetical protein